MPFTYSIVSGKNISFAYTKKLKIFIKHTFAYNKNLIGIIDNNNCKIFKQLFFFPPKTFNNTA